MNRKPTHASVAGKRYLALQRLARAHDRPTAELLQIYVLEGLLRRLGRSRHAGRFVLKGGMLLAAFDLRRATRDIDLLALVTDDQPGAALDLVVDVIAVEVEDGVEFLRDTLASRSIQAGKERPGVRAALEARLSTARIKLILDLSTGDPVVPAPIRVSLPTILGDESIEVLAYPKEMVVVEKLATALQRGRANTRWRDFADLLALTQGQLRESELIEALRAVAAHRGITLQPLGEVLDAMPEKAQARWATWRARHGAEDRVPAEFASVLAALDERTRRWLRAANKGS